MRVAIYARYSSDKQNESSIEDQVRICKDLAVQNDHVVIDILTDAALTGSDLNRPALQYLINNCHLYDVVICEALDRLSRDQADTPALFKHLEYHNVQIITVSEGLINEMHIGLKGTMNALFLKELANKTRRGLSGRVLKGKSGGGNSFGYDVVNEVKEDGTIARGDRTINLEQSKIVERIFYEYTVMNRSAKTIAIQLNREGVRSPSGGEWSPSTISGNRRRGTGIINNELYNGRLVWNRQRYSKNPITKKRISRLNPENQLIITDVPHLKIISDELWQQTRNQQSKLSVSNSAEPKMRPKYLLSDLIKCSSCGGGFSMINGTRYGCSKSRNKGTCNFRTSIKRDEIEQTVLDFFKDKLITNEFIELFIREYNSEISLLSLNHNKHEKQREKRAGDLAKQEANLINSIKHGLPYDLVKDDLKNIENELALLKKESTQKKQPVVERNDLAFKYKSFVKTLSSGSLEIDAVNLLRDLIDKIVIYETDGELDIDLYVNYDGFLPKKIRPANSGRSNLLVAGAGFEPTTFGL